MSLRLQTESAELRWSAPSFRSSAYLLALVYVLVVVYASLYPFTGWRVGGLQPLAFLSQALPLYWTAFDLISNWLGYVPLGLLVFVAFVRKSWRPWLAFVLSVMSGGALSFVLEFLQNFLPQRVPSNLDWLLNFLGTLVGAMLGSVLFKLGYLSRWQLLRDRWFVQPSSAGLALLLIWPVGLLFPLSFPFAMGRMLDRLLHVMSSGMGELLSAFDLPIIAPSSKWQGLTPSGEFLLVMLGILAPCCLAIPVTRRGWRRVALIALVVISGILATSLSTALSFGPEHAWVWATPTVCWAVCAGGIVALVFSLCSRRVSAALGLMVITALLIFVTQAPANPYFAQNLQDWEQGQFIRFHGVSQWVGWLWPFLAMAYLIELALARYAHPLD
jgi:VanZ family protein